MSWSVPNNLLFRRKGGLDLQRLRSHGVSGPVGAGVGLLREVSEPCGPGRCSSPGPASRRGQHSAAGRVRDGGRRRVGAPGCQFLAALRGPSQQECVWASRDRVLGLSVQDQTGDPSHTRARLLPPSLTHQGSSPPPAHILPEPTVEQRSLALL